MNLLKRKRVLVPLAIISMLIAAYAQQINKDKETITGYFHDKGLDELSGMAASTMYSARYYVHNDSGDTSRFFAVGPDGKLQCTYYFKGESSEPTGVRDCEDIAVGPGIEAGKSYVYLGDIGDNQANRKYVAIYRFDEADLNIDTPVRNINATAFYLKYPDGPKDAETLMIDPVERLLYIVSKRKRSVNIYTTSLAIKSNDTATLVKRGSMHFGGLPPFKWITAGDISKDGSQILLRNYHNVYYWKRPLNIPAWQIMTGKAKKLPYKHEKQGEAIAFTPDGKGYYTTSEGLDEPVYYYHTPQ